MRFKAQKRKFRKDNSTNGFNNLLSKINKKTLERHLLGVGLAATAAFTLSKGFGDYDGAGHLLATYGGLFLVRYIPKISQLSVGAAGPLVYEMAQSEFRFGTPDSSDAYDGLIGTLIYIGANWNEFVQKETYFKSFVCKLAELADKPNSGPYIVRASPMFLSL